MIIKRIFSLFLCIDLFICSSFTFQFGEILLSIWKDLVLLSNRFESRLSIEIALNTIFIFRFVQFLWYHCSHNHWDRSIFYMTTCQFLFHNISLRIVMSCAQNYAHNESEYFSFDFWKSIFIFSSRRHHQFQLMILNMYVECLAPLASFRVYLQMFYDNFRCFHDETIGLTSDTFLSSVLHYITYKNYFVH